MPTGTQPWAHGESNKTFLKIAPFKGSSKMSMKCIRIDMLIIDPAIHHILNTVHRHYPCIEIVVSSDTGINYGLSVILPPTVNVVIV